MHGFTTALEKLEFDSVLGRIRSHAVSDSAKALVSSIRPSVNRKIIEDELLRVSQAKELLIAEGTVPLAGLRDTLVSLKKTTVENQVLSPRELIEIAELARTSRTMAQFLLKRKALYPLLAPAATRLNTDKVLEYNITQAIDEYGSVRDTASKELGIIRREIIEATSQLRKRLEGILKRVSEQEFAQDEILTTRDGRMVIPVKTEYKKRVPGFIHSSSASGATVFIEPAETLELNNELREVQIREQREIERILKALTSQVGEQRESLEESLNALIDLDLLWAKAKYSIEIQGSTPKLSEGRTLRLYQARHPVLLERHKREEVVPLDFPMDDSTTTVLITGPNAGGKSVALKTVGLLALMTQAGLHIPASTESELPIFESVFVDIGDDQSIENDLSTFSSHLLNLQAILEKADRSSLVLIDEIGAGTDPVEGGALAAAVLTELTRRKAFTIATTHHGSLKVFAHETEGVTNASMEFDQDSLRPTYRFRMGVPGSSYAFELAERLGMPKDFLRHARSYISSDRLQLERLLVELEKTMQQYSADLREARRQRDEYERLAREYEQRLSAIQKETREMKREAAEKAQQLVADAQSLIERSIKDIRESQADKNTIRQVRENIAAAQRELEGLRITDVSPAETFKIGDIVRLKSGSAAGEIVSIRDDVATVLIDNARLRVKIDELVRSATISHSWKPSTAEYTTVEAGTEIDIRGMTGEEAINHLQQFLDNAYVAGLHRVDIIHGKGTGALRKKVSAFLKSYPHVRSFRLGEWNEGGAGVTVVEFADQ
ncbi:MAG TPA: endonuclease MutS2 [Bacteroidota bacterium]|nr:endonuclease MutS2 [Bacteroidota bacterium]